MLLFTLNFYLWNWYFWEITKNVWLFLLISSVPSHVQSISSMKYCIVLRSTRPSRTYSCTYCRYSVGDNALAWLPWCHSWLYISRCRCNPFLIISCHSLHISLRILTHSAPFSPYIGIRCRWGWFFLGNSSFHFQTFFFLLLSKIIKNTFTIKRWIVLKIHKKWVVFSLLRFIAL